MILRIIEFISKTFGTGKDTTATIAVTLATFTIGILVTAIFKAIENFLDRMNHRIMFRLNLLNLIREMHRQRMSYRKFADGLIIGKSTPEFKQISISTLSIYQQLGYKDSYNSFFNGFENIRLRNGNKFRESFNLIWSTLQFLNLFHQKTFKDASEFIEAERKANELRNEAIASSYNIINSIRFTYHKQKVQRNLGVYCNTIESILKENMAHTDNTNPQIVNDSIILPIMALNNDNVDLMKDYMDVLQPVAFGDSLNISVLRYENQKNLIISNQKYFRHLDEEFSRHIDKLKSSYKNLFR
ncbi:MAG: hypothetical protein ABI367_05225 [Mucilaginibacter sp.]